MKRDYNRVLAWSFSVLTVSMPLAACSSEEPAAQPPQPATSEAAPAVQISNPKDATAVDPCDILPNQTATELGLLPEGRPAEEENLCQWVSEDRSLYVAFAPLENRSIQEYYDNKTAFVDYGELTIAGYPTVRANQGNPAEDGFCDFFLATNDNQVLHAAGSDSSLTDPCGLAQKALEAAVSNLPAAN